jgi:acyl-CoA dehydrogenase
MTTIDANAETELLLSTAVDLGRRFGLEWWREQDEAHRFPEELWRTLGEEGWLGSAIPEAYGGSGLGLAEAIGIIEAVAAGGGGSTVGQVFMGALLPAASLMRHGTDEQKREFLPKIASGEIFFGIALTEPDAGSNALATATRGAKVDGGYRLRGQKIYITAVERADLLQVLARTTLADEAGGRGRGLTLFALNPKADGVEFAPMPKLGTRTMSTSMLYLDDAFVPDSAVLGAVDDGWKVLVDALNVERLITAAAALGAGELALSLAVQYATNRVVFSKPLGANQAIAFPLAHAKAQLACSRALLAQAAALFDASRPCAAEGNMAKLIATEASFDACDQAMQTFGGAGYMVEQHIERLWRDARLWKIAPVSQEMALSFVAQNVLRLPRSY